MSLVSRIDDFQRRHPAIGLPLSVIYKCGDDGAGMLASHLTYCAFLSLFPLLLLASTILGIVLSGHPDLQQQLLDSALAQFPVVGDDLSRPEAISSGAIGIVVGSLGALYGALGVGQAVQNASDTAWTVPRNERPNPIKARGRSAVLLLVIGSDVIGTTVLAGIIGSADFLGVWGSVAGLVGSLAVHAAAFAVVFRFGTVRALTWRDVLPGAALAAAGWLGLQYVGVAYVSRTVNGSSATAGTFALVLGLLGFLYLTSVVILLCLEVNVVLVERLHPRSLLTPFTDNVVLTPGDKRSYTDRAEAQQLKGFQRVEVEFGPSPAETQDD